MNFKRLRMLLIASFMLVSLIPFASFGHKVISQGERLIEKKASSYLKGLSQRNAEAIKRFMKERTNDMNTLANVIDNAQFDLSMLKFHFDQMKLQYAPYLGFLVLDKSGKSVFSSLNVLNPPPLHSLVKSNTSGFNACVKNISIFNIENEQIPSLVICAPLLKGTEHHLGSVCALVDFRHIDSILRKSNIENTGEVYLIDENGRFLSSSRFGAKALRDHISMDSIGKKKQGLYETTDYRGERVLQAYQKIDDFPWYVMADQDMAEILNQIKILEREAIAYGIMTATIVFILAFFISTIIVNILKSKYQYEKELEFQVIQKEKLASLGLLTSGLAHELNTPLANALLYSQLAKEELNEPEIEIDTIQERLSTVVDEVRQGSRIISNLLDFSRHSPNDTKSTDINTVLTKLMDITRPHCISNKIEVALQLEKGIPFIKADASTLQAILTNLVANAIEAMSDGGKLRLRTRFFPALKIIKIEVGDSGPGIPRDESIKIFNPFFTTKKQGKGTGLGLFISHQMARKLGGDIKVISSTGENAKNAGTLFTVQLPAE